MNGLNYFRQIVCLFLFCALLGGCAGVETFPNYARNGDTISVALGGIRSSEHGALNATGATAEVVDANGDSHDVTFKYSLRMLPDPTSSYYAAGEFLRGIVDAQLVAVVDLVDPSLSTPTNIPAGPATITLTFPNGEIFVPTLSGFNVTNTVSSDILIIDDQLTQGAPHIFEYYWPLTGGTNSEQVHSLEPLPQIILTTVDLTPDTDAGFSDGLAAVEYVVEYAASDFPSSESSSPQIVYMGMESNMQVFTRYEDLPNGTVRMTARLLNPYGFNGFGRRAGGFPNCAVVWVEANQPIDNTNWDSFFQLTSAKFFDINGEAMNGSYDAVVVPHIQ